MFCNLFLYPENLISPLVFIEVHVVLSFGFLVCSFGLIAWYFYIFLLIVLLTFLCCFGLVSHEIYIHVAIVDNKQL